MAVDFFIKRGDTLPKLRKNLVSADGTNPDITGGSVVLIMSLPGATTPKVNRAACTIVDGPTALVEYPWIAADTNTAGEYEAEFEVNKAGIETFPNPRKMTIVVTEDLG